MWLRLGVILGSLSSCASVTSDAPVVLRVEATQTLVRTGACDLSPGDVVQVFRTFAKSPGKTVSGVVTSVIDGYAYVSFGYDAHLLAGDRVYAYAPRASSQPGYVDHCR